MFETVVVPHGNEERLLKDLQRALLEKCASFVPCFPLFVRFAQGEPVQIERVSIEEMKLFRGAVVLVAKVGSSRRFVQGSVRLGKIAGGRSAFSSDDMECGFSPFALPVFKVADVEFEGDEDFFRWRVVSERWVKAGRTP